MTFEEFWPLYQKMHSRRATQIAHAIGSIGSLACIASGIALRKPLLIAAGPLFDYAISQASHRIFEKNKTMPWKNQFFHTRAEFRMLRLVLAGKMPCA